MRFRDGAPLTFCNGVNAGSAAFIVDFFDLPAHGYSARESSHEIKGNLRDQMGDVYEYQRLFVP